MKDDALIDHPTLGVIHLDYDYPAALGDIDHPESFNYPVVYRVVPGLTYQMAQSGKMTDEVGKEFDEAIQYLAHVRKVSAITADCGFMMWFQQRARALVKVPVFLSSLMQLPTISVGLCKQQDKVVIMTANLKSLRPMQDLINEISGVRKEHEHYKYVGCEDIPYFGYEVENGLQVNVKKAGKGILQKAREAVQSTPGCRAILLECSELPPYANLLRSELGLPVYDAVTHCDYVMSAFLNHKRFGNPQKWFKPWNGIQETYKFGQELTDEQKKRLVATSSPITKPVIKSSKTKKALVQKGVRGQSPLCEGIIMMTATSPKTRSHFSFDHIDATRCIA